MPPFSLTSCISLRKVKGTSTRSSSHLPSLAKGSQLSTGAYAAHSERCLSRSKLPAPCRITSHQHSNVMVSPISTKPSLILVANPQLSLSAVPFSLHGDGSC